MRWIKMVGVTAVNRQKELKVTMQGEVRNFSWSFFLGFLTGGMNAVGIKTLDASVFYAVSSCQVLVSEMNGYKE